MSINFLGIIFIPFIIILAIKSNLKQLFIVTFILSTFTATGIINLNFIDFTITIPQLCALILWIKILILVYYRKIKLNINIPYLLIFFICYCGISLIYPLIFSKGIIVLNPDNIYEPIGFKFQMITQYAYLLLGFLIFIATLIILKNIKFEIKDMVSISRYVIILFNVMMILQLVLPIELYNTIFRDISASNNQMVGQMIRLTGPTYEASILSMTCLPFLGVLILAGKSKIDFITIIISIALIITTKSSTFLIGIISLLFLSLVYWIPILLNLIKTINKKRKIIYLLILFFSIIVMCFFIKDPFILLLDKLNGNGESGSLRLGAFYHHINIFKGNFITGVGFGTIRSYDLLSTWLASLGIIGFGSFIIYLIFLIYKLFRNRQNFIYIQFLIVIFISLFLSVPEPYYLFIWMGIGIAQYSSRIENIC